MNLDYGNLYKLYKSYTQVTLNMRTPLIHKVFWWRPSSIEMRGETLFGVDPFLRYDTFQFFYPYGSRVDPKKKSLCYQFLEVDIRNQTQVTRFSRQYGLLGRLDNPGWVRWSLEQTDRLHILDQIVEPDGSLPGFLNPSHLYTDLVKQSAGVGPAHDLCRKMELSDFVASQHQLTEMLEWISRVKNHPSKGKTASRLRNEIIQRFRWKLSMIRPFLSLEKNVWVVSWDVGSLEAAMYLMILFDFQGGANFVSCLRCQKAFLGKNIRAKFCSPRCLNAYKVHKHRERKRDTT